MGLVMVSSVVQLVRAAVRRELVGFCLKTCWLDWQMQIQTGEGRALWV
jgi:hypothetical protein